MSLIWCAVFLALNVNMHLTFKIHLEYFCEFGFHLHERIQLHGVVTFKTLVGMATSFYFYGHRSDSIAGPISDCVFHMYPFYMSIHSALPSLIWSNCKILLA